VTGQPPVTSVGSDQALKVTVNLGDVAKVLHQAPRIAHFWLHGFLHRSFVLHRLSWLRRKGSRFGRGSTDAGNKAVKVHEVNRGPSVPAEQDVVYRVTPAEQKAATTAAAVQGLQQMGAEAFAGSLVLKVHEFGEDIRTPGLMAVPVKTRPKSPRRWLEKYPGKRLEFRPSTKRPGEGLLFEVTRSRGRGRPRRDGTAPPLRERLRLRFILTRAVEMDPTLHMYGTWDALQGQRAKLWSGAASKMHEQLQRHDLRDF
jgi:hypothetical protein